MAQQRPTPLEYAFSAADDHARLPRRAGYGTIGRTFRASSNNFVINVGNCRMFHHFHVTITDSGSHEPAPGFLAKRIVSNLMAREAATFNCRGGFDGMVNLYIPHDLGLSMHSHKTWMASPDDRDDPHSKEYEVTLKKVGLIDVPFLIAMVLKGQVPLGEQGMEAFRNLGMASTVLNVLFQMVGRDLIENREGKTTKNTVFFPPDQPYSLNVPFLELWSGYYQKLKATQNQLLMTVDITYGLVIRAGNLVDVVMAVFGLRDVRALNAPPRDNEALRLHAKIKRFLQSVFVVCDYGNSRLRKRKKRVGGITTDSARDHQFSDNDGNMMSVEEHYARTYQKQLRYPNSLCAVFGKNQDRVYPLEVLLVTPGQQFKGELPPDVTRAMVDISSNGGPKRRRELISEAKKNLQYDSSDFLRSSSITVASHPLQLAGRFLDRPELYVGNEEKVILPESTQWMLPRKKFFAPMQVHSWAVLTMLPPRDDRDAEQVANRFANDIAERLHNLGLRGDNGAPIPRAIIIRGAQGGNVDGYLAQLREAACDVFGIMPRPSDQDLIAFKHWGDVAQGVPTQVVQFAKIRSGAKDDYLHNLATKVNLKLGGFNWVLPMRALPGFVPQTNQYRSTLIIGADVSHPPAGNITSPSICGVVASINPQLTRFGADISIQTGGRRVETIMDLKNIMVRLLTQHRRMNDPIPSGIPPERRKQMLLTAWPQIILFYRDGVGEQQYASVTEFELQALMKAIDEVQASHGEPDAPKPMVTFIIVTKHHHQRFFPEESSAADKNGNCKAGAVFDKDIGHPILFDFYLQSQAAIKGTARPAHYIVTHNENPELDSNKLQQLSYNLCYVYERATKAVSIPAPVYYADLVCRRAKFHWHPDFDMSVTSSAEGRDDPDRALAIMQQRFGRIHPNQQHKMWFV